MFYSPFRSIIIGEKRDLANNDHIEIIENSIGNYRKNMEFRKPDIVNKDDYSLIDFELLESALGEHKRNLESSN